jgi:hypothetical protein
LFSKEARMIVENARGLVPLTDLPSGTFFIAQNHHGSHFGISIRVKEEIGAVLLNKAVKDGEPFPCVVTADFMQNSLLLAFPDAYFVPDFSESSLAPSSCDIEGPGELLITESATILRCARRLDGFRYFDLGSGAQVSTPQGDDFIHIRKWSVCAPGKDGIIKSLFHFAGPKPIK